MKHHYDDILNLVTKLTRDWHREILTQYQGGQSTACTTGPKKNADNVIDFLDCDCSCIATPLWWDENGVPRFVAHHPNHSADIYAEEVALVLIACQSCRREFPVQITMSTMDRVRQLAMSGSAGRPIAIAEELFSMTQASSNDVNPEPLQKLGAEIDVIRARKMTTLAEQVSSGSIHYGDPPNTGCCPAGPTMNCLDLRVLEFWRRPSFDWERVPELERELPDATDPEFQG